MNGGILPFVLLGLTLGLALTSVPRDVALKAWVAALVVAVVFCLVPIGDELVIPVEVGLWVTTILTGVAVYLPSRLRRRLINPVAVNAGLWLGALASAAVTRSALLVALPLSLVFLLISMMGLQKYQLAVRVVASWMIAIGSLAVFVSMVPTPGYKQDHMQ